MDRWMVRVCFYGNLNRREGTTTACALEDRMRRRLATNLMPRRRQFAGTVSVMRNA